MLACLHSMLPRLFWLRSRGFVSYRPSYKTHQTSSYINAICNFPSVYLVLPLMEFRFRFLFPCLFRLPAAQRPSSMQMLGFRFLGKAGSVWPSVFSAVRGKKNSAHERQISAFRAFHRRRTFGKIKAILHFLHFPKLYQPANKDGIKPPRTWVKQFSFRLIL